MAVILLVDNGSQTGTPPITHSYDWKRDTVSIGAPDLNTYTTVPADEDTTITCEVTASNVFGSDMDTSNGIFIDEDTPPAFTANPVLTGDSDVGSLMSVTDGVVTGSAPITFTYDWKRDAVSIGAPDLNTYTTVVADENTTLTCEVTATNAFGSDMATSNGIAIASFDNKITESGDNKITESGDNKIMEQ